MSDVADRCRELGLRIGDTIFGREEGPGGYWHEARLTLLWLGQEEAMWRVRERSNLRLKWSAPREAGDWTLECRDWRKDDATPSAPSSSQQGEADAERIAKLLRHLASLESAKSGEVGK